MKRITVVSGHYGSGKTNIAVNLALEVKKTHPRVALCDIDIVNPYFRSKDSSDILEKNGIRLICSEYANSNVDIPALPQDMYSIRDDRSLFGILDVGGDDRGALALGRLAPSIREENDFEMLYVVNRFRPLTCDAVSAVEVMREIEAACRLNFTGIINNSNLGRETTLEDVLSSVPYAEEISKITSLPVVKTTVSEKLYIETQGKIPDLFPLRLQKNF